MAIGPFLTVVGQSVDTADEPKEQIQNVVIPRALYSGVIANFPWAPECSILDDGRHVMSQRGMVGSLRSSQESRPIANREAQRTCVKDATK